MRRWASASIRARLTGWYAAVLAALLLIYATTTFFAVRHALLEQLDQQLHEEFEAAEERLERTPDGRVDWSGDQGHHQDGEDARVYEVWSATGEQIHRSGSPAALPPLALPMPASAYRYETVVAGTDRWRALSAPVNLGGLVVTLRVSRSEAPLGAELREILIVLLLGLPLGVALAGVGGYVLARRALAPIDHLAAEARRITADRLHERLSVPHERDEIGRLAAVFNETFSRLESSFEQLRRFTADSSHELRTPLAVIRGIGEVAVAERRAPVEYEEAIGSMLEEVDRMSRLVDTLLRLSHGDAGVVRLAKERVDMRQLVREVLSSLAVLAEDRNQVLAFEAGEGVMASVDRLVIREAFTNVLDNAIKYSAAGDTIDVRIERDVDHIVVVFADRGPGVLPEHRSRIFDRFFRVDQSRTRESGGAGLGLAIAKWAVELHRGTITVADRPGGGAEFRIHLPVADE